MINKLNSKHISPLLIALIPLVSFSFYIANKQTEKLPSGKEPVSMPLALEAAHLEAVHLEANAQPAHSENALALVSAESERDVSEVEEPLLLPANGYLARIELNSPESLKQALLRAEQLYLEGRLREDTPPPVIIIHGPEVSVFLKENYHHHKHIVDLAARLSALEVLDLRVCLARIGALERSKSALYPFVGTVPYGPKAINALLNEEGFIYF